MNEYLETDVLIIGSGIAGSSAALILAEAGIDTILISKGKDFSETNTNWAQGGIACLGQNEKSQDFINDILKSGDFINKPSAVEQVVRESRSLVEKILIQKLEIPFSTSNGNYDLAFEAAHSKRRILNIKDMSGKIIQEYFYAYLKKLKKLKK